MNNYPFKNYYDFIEHYEIFFKNVKNNIPIIILDCHKILMDVKIDLVGCLATKEIETLLTPNNNIDNLKRKLNIDIQKLSTLHKEVLDEHNFNNEKSENFKYFSIFVDAVSSFDKFTKDMEDVLAVFDGKLVVIGEKEVFVDEKQRELLNKVSKKDLLNIKLKE